MPTYEYQCNKCGHRMEEFQSITAKPLKRCPSCSKNGLVRLIGTGAGILFRGSGFYSTDYRSESYKQAAKADKEGSTKSGTDTKTDTKTETKPEAKTETASDKSTNKKKEKVA